MSDLEAVKLAWVSYCLTPPFRVTHISLSNRLALPTSVQHIVQSFVVVHCDQTVFKSQSRKTSNLI